MKKITKYKKSTIMKVSILCSVCLISVFATVCSEITGKDFLVGEEQEIENALNSDSCYPNPCRNGGTCTSNIFGYRCDCAYGYTGTNCDETKSYCSSYPCRHGGTCHEVLDFNGVSFDYRCSCTTDYYGLDCDFKSTTVNPLHIAVPFMCVLFLISCISVIYYRRRRRVLAHIILTEDTSQSRTTHPPPPASNVYTMPPPVDPPPAYQPQTYGAYNNPPAPQTYGAYDNPPAPQTYGAYDNPPVPSYPGNHQVPPYSNQPMTQYPKY